MIGGEEGRITLKGDSPGEFMTGMANRPENPQSWLAAAKGLPKITLHSLQGF
jgi:hypothetical protein